MDTKNKTSANHLSDSLSKLLDDMLSLREQVVAAANKRIKKFRHCYPNGNISHSAYNLACYLALRQLDLTPLQDRLAKAGLSSLGRSESYVLSNIDAVIEILRHATLPGYEPESDTEGIERGFTDGYQLLESHTAKLFGYLPGPRHVHIMVTMPTEAAWDKELIDELLKHGMSCARINCAHDNEEVWGQIIANIKKSAAETGKTCQVLIDLGGHKIRTGPVALQPAIQRLRIKKNIYGETIKPAEIILSSNHGRDYEHQDIFTLGMPKELDEMMRVGDTLQFTDTRHKKRLLLVTKKLSPGNWLLTCDKNAYLPANVMVLLGRVDGNGKKHEIGIYKLGDFAGEPEEIKIYRDDKLLLTTDEEPGHAARYDQLGKMLEPARIGCTLGSILSKLKEGDPVWIDDGKIGAVAEEVYDNKALLKVTRARKNGVTLRADKGINFPHTKLDLPAFSQKDLHDLDFVCKHADMVGFSFIEKPEDMEIMMRELAKRNAAHLPVIAKIETKKAVQNLPDIILSTMGRHRLGIMIARGDLAVELGNINLAEIQEEMLWICESAHIPVIWATQVLETITQKGFRSRAEFTDAAMSVRAECVMLNKGPYIIDAVKALSNILERMGSHQHKKFSRMKALDW